MPKENAYDRIIVKVFNDNYHRGSERVDFSRVELARAARAQRIAVPKNLGDVVYT